ncbi:MAG: B12-binding domain-containing protein, partial [Isosphaeraceae bacterium]
SQRIIDGNRNGLETDLTEALDSGMGALAIVNDVLLEGMKVVGERFASGEMQLPFVLQSAETMKAAVAFLEPFMEKADQGGKGTVVLATVKGDVHDIGKNLVDIILTNNGYEVINLGIKIGINEMIAAAEEHKADAIGMSGLLVKSTLIMRENLVELNQRDLAGFPILLGGAALTRTYVERDLREIYDGRLFYGRDAFEGLRTMDRLVELKKSGEEDPLFGREISTKNVPKRSRLDPQETTPVEGQPARADIASDNQLFSSVTSGGSGQRKSMAKTTRNSRIACGQFCARRWRRPRRVISLSPRWRTVTSPPTPKGTTSSYGKTSHATLSGCGSPSHDSARNRGSASL